MTETTPPYDTDSLKRVMANDQREVYKYPAPIADTFTISMPQGAELLTSQVQRGSINIWALVHPDAPLEARHFRLAGTGHAIEGQVKYLATLQLSEETLAFHLFECEPFARHVTWGYGS